MGADLRAAGRSANTTDRRAGEPAFSPRGFARTYANLSGAPGRALFVITPAGFERRCRQ
jgi:hypothetical protein